MVLLGGNSRADDLPGWLVRELHDGPAQRLLYLGLELSALEASLPPGMTECQRRLAALRQVAQEGYDEVRALLGLLRSGGAGLCDLRSEIAQCVESFRSKVSIRVESDLGSPGTPLEVPRWIAHHVTAVLREALANAYRHSKAEEVRVVLEEDEAALKVCVADNGQGFTPFCVEEGHHGLSIMQERCQAIGGQLELDSTRGAGTRVALRLPKQVLRSLGPTKGVSDGD